MQLQNKFQIENGGNDKIRRSFSFKDLETFRCYLILTQARKTKLCTISKTQSVDV